MYTSQNLALPRKNPHLFRVFHQPWHHVNLKLLVLRSEIRATKSCNLSRNIVTLQVAKRCCSYFHPRHNLSRNKKKLLKVEKLCFKK